MARHITYANVTATLALIIATSGVSYAAISIPRNSVGSPQLKRNAVTSTKIRTGAVGTTDLARSVRARLDAAGRRGPTGLTGAAGTTGPQGPKGDKGDRGLNAAASRQVPNVNDIACGQDVVVGSTPLTVTEPSRVWTHAHGSIANEQSGNTEAGLWLRLRDAGNTTTLAVSVAAWDGRLVAQSVSPLDTGGLLLAGSNPNAPADPYTVAPGSYVLELVVLTQGSACMTAKPRFGWNQGAAMGYVLVGTA
ncbi:MAG TPA: collagen-like protein [Baekduia sp.]|uniref:collagen-like triple helix repeat-containing protein n=1 Tax=Baekduia sp. TaxID=2600305 RepID=UPI002C81E70D|nr:collagen-like protein [Baekduia sp.]HMJ35170.1 collagen-like protein [Baekduia sp.]